MSEAQKTEDLHLTAEHVKNLSTAYGDTVEMLCLRAQYVADIIAYGVDVKTIAADMAAANRADSSVPTVSPQTLGQARLASTVADMIGTTLTAWIKRDPHAVAAVVRAGHPRVAGIKAVTTAVRDALKPIDAEKHMAREEVAMTTVDALASRILPEPTPEPRKTADEKTADKTAAGKTETRKIGADMDAATARDAVRAVTAWLTTGAGSWSPDLESALAELRSAATAARKRGQAPTSATPATVKRTTRKTATATPATAAA